MAKALELNLDTLAAAPPMPRAAQITAPPAIRDMGSPTPGAGRVPLQVRWPMADVKAAKLAAIEMDFPTVSDFMLACFHAYMQSRMAKPPEQGCR
jgi:hypothetical protein